MKNVSSNINRTHWIYHHSTCCSLAHVFNLFPRDREVKPTDRRQRSDLLEGSCSINSAHLAYAETRSHDTLQSRNHIEDHASTHAKQAWYRRTTLWHTCWQHLACHIVAKKKQFQTVNEDKWYEIGSTRVVLNARNHTFCCTLEWRCGCELTNIATCGNCFKQQCLPCLERFFQECSRIMPSKWDGPFLNHRRPLIQSPSSDRSIATMSNVTRRAFDPDGMHNRFHAFRQGTTNPRSFFAPLISNSLYH